MSNAENVHREIHFEDHIFEYLTETLPKAEQWLSGDAAKYDRERALYPEDVVDWLRESAPEKWERLEQLHDAQAERRVLDALVKKLTNRQTGGALEVLRRGFSVAGAGTLLMSQSRPEGGSQRESAGALPGEPVAGCASAQVQP